MGKSLIVEDDKLDRYLIRRAFQVVSENIEIEFAEDAESALEILTVRDAPSVIVTDLRMPGIGGMALLSRLKSDESLRRIPAVVFSTSSESEDIQQAYDNYANSYVVKPDNSAGYERFALRLRDYWLEENRLAS